MSAEQTLRKARETHAGLLSGRASIELRLGDLATERQGVALAAHTGDARTRAALTKLNDLIAREGSELESIKEAIEQSLVAIEEAEADLQHEEAIARARRARAIVPELHACGRDAEAALEEFAARMHDFYTLSDELKSLGVGGPSSGAQ